ncbi:uncharacterized protein yc1106_01762 [Curvularia clavata]|uniref:DNA-directed DNA polymerase n=1 Tax=Curvularia clavata TaxID=95742 RepID=A0A9Q8Z544_CURCL|nr:uncharacterized protein yc1106_01762 [Curvularia clavata]
MSDFDRLAKEAYFQEQSLLDLSDDDDVYTPNESLLNLERALAESKSIKPLSLPKKTSSFLGPTPREMQAQFEEHAMQQRASGRQVNQRLTRSCTAPQPEANKSSRTAPSRNSVAGSAVSSKSRLKRTISVSQLLEKESIHFYRRVGAIPRELKSGKNVKPATNIKLAPEHKQLLKGKIVYFYPNDDISMARRRRIHKTIELGAAWVKDWSDDITHIIVDDDTYTYAQLMRHLDRPIPSNVVVVKFDPYIPRCIDRGELFAPTASFFAVKGAEGVAVLGQTPEPSHESTTSQSSLKVKASKRQMVTRGSQKTDSYTSEESISFTHPTLDTVSSGLFEETVEDSFVMPSETSGEPAPKPVDQFGDTLSQAIQEAKALMHLPLDEEEEVESVRESDVDAENSGTDEEPLDMGPERLRKLGIVSKASALRDKKSLSMSNFQCMNPNPSGHTSQNPNARTIQILDEMCRHYEQMQDQWRTLSYRKCIATLKQQTVKITTAEQAAKLRFVGPRLATKIEEIVITDRLRRLESTRDDHLDVALRLFLGVYGAGLMQAHKWVQAGYRTLEDLKTKAKLTESQKIGVEHYDDFNARIPRAEVEAHGAIVNAALKQIDPQFSATIMGSYRRGAKDSGDIDMIFSRPNTSLATMRTTIFDVLIPHLYKTGILKASLTMSRSNDSSGSKWHGASCLPTSTVWRRIDFLLVPEQEMGAALLYFTGSDIFNRSMRLLARKKGMCLNQKGLYKDVKRGKHAGKLNQGVLVESRSEKRIFEILGVPWREPEERNC